MKKSKILIVDDEKDLLKALKDTLAGEGYEIRTAETGNDAINLIKKENPDLVLLDLRLPDIDGYDVCRSIKKDMNFSHIPIIMVSTRSKDAEKIVGLEIGADDYITKPYNPLELLARIRVALRKNSSQKKPMLEQTSLIRGKMEINPEFRSVKINSKPIKLTRKEFDLIFLLASKPGKVFSRPVIMESVWGYSYDSLQGTVDSHIKTLRKKLGIMGKFIETITGIGYRWTEED